MIKSVFIVNNQGKARLARFYQETPVDQRRAIMSRVHGIISKRSDELTCCFALDPQDPSYKIIYRHYATLYFVFIVDDGESELGILDLLQVRGRILIDEKLFV
jgi:AP-3 complex subunit sigma